MPPHGVVGRPVGGGVHLPIGRPLYTVSGTTEPAPGSFSNKDAMLAFVRAHLPDAGGTVTIAIHRVPVE